MIITLTMTEEKLLFTALSILKWVFHGKCLRVRTSFWPRDSYQFLCEDDLERQISEIEDLSGAYTLMAGNGEKPTYLDFLGKELLSVKANDSRYESAGGDGSIRCQFEERDHQ